MNLVDIQTMSTSQAPDRMMSLPTEVMLLHQQVGLRYLMLSVRIDEHRTLWLGELYVSRDCVCRLYVSRDCVGGAVEGGL